MVINEEQETQIVVFRLNNELYGLDIFQVKEIIRFTAITNVPSAPDFVEGIINLRGKVTPIIDLNRKFALGKFAGREDSKIIIAEIRGQVLGLIVDGVEAVLRLRNDLIEMPTTLTGVVAQYVKGVGKVDDKLLILLELDNLLGHEELSQLEEVG